ncbi:MAG: OpgC domain-containing protein [Chloroflexota bacterium]
MDNKKPVPTQLNNPEEDSQVTKLGTVIRVSTATWSAEPAKRWRYTSGRDKRDLRLDAIRGIAVLVMLINHLGGEESWLYALTGNDSFFISAAEPFVFISGLVMGIVYASVISKQGIVPAVKKAFKRAALLYALTVGVGLAFALLSLQFNLPWAPHWTEEGLGGFVLSIVTLQRSYYLTDIFLLYTLLVASAIPALFLLACGYWWIVLGGSWALWGAWQRWPNMLDLPWHIMDNEIFHFAPWQILFFTALMIGYHRESVEHLLAKGRDILGRAAQFVKLTWQVRNAQRAQLAEELQISNEALIRVILVVTGIMVAASVILYQWVRYTPGSMDDLTLARMFEKAGVRPGRLLEFVPFMLFAFALLTTAWKPIKSATGWLLLPLGQSALLAFTLHLFVGVFIVKLRPVLEATFPALGPVENNAAVSTLLQVAGIGFVWMFIVLVGKIRVMNKRLAQQTGSTKHTGSRERTKRMKVARIVLPASGLIIVLIFMLLGRKPVAQALKELNDKGLHTLVPVATSTARVPVRASVPTVTVTVVAQFVHTSGAMLLATATESIADNLAIMNEVIVGSPGEVYSAILSDTSPVTITTITSTTSPQTSAIPTGTPTDVAVANPIPIPSKTSLFTSVATVATVTATHTPDTALAAVAAISSTSISTGVPTTPTATGTPPILMSQGMEVHNFTSAALGRSMEYAIYLPPGYYEDAEKGEQGKQRYPVAYMLHGMDASAGQWAGYGLLKDADRMMRSGEIQPFIIVLPQGDGSYWFDHANGGPRWGTYLVRDVVGEIDTQYRTIADRDHRAIGGLSMGAHAALELSINYPEVFGIAGAHSPSLHSHETAPHFFGDEAYFRKHDPASLYAGMPEVARTIKLWVDLGEQDAWLPIVEGFHQELDKYNIPHEWHVYPGGHIGEYWSEHSPDYLRFYDAAFSGTLP